MKTKLKHIICHFILVFFIFNSFSKPAFAQHYESLIKKVIDQKGNSPSGTFSIVEDKDGFIWFGTVEGLYKYDGYNFKIFRHDKYDQKSLSGNTIRALYIDDDKLWIGTQGGGLNCLDLGTEKITRYIHTGNSENEISGNSIWALMIDSKGDLWVGFTEKGVDKFDKRTGEFTNYDIFVDHEIKKFETTARTIFEDKDGKVWIGVGNFGLIQIDPETEKIERYFQDQTKNSLNSSSIVDITDDEKGNLLICTYGGGINIYNKHNNVFDFIIHDTENVNSVVSDLTYCIRKSKNNIYWIGTEYGVNKYDPLNNIFTNYVHNSCIDNSITDNRIRSIFIDSNNIVWLGTESGVNKIIQQNKFLLHKYRTDELNSLPKGIVRAILEDDEDNLWIGIIDYGLVHFDSRTKKYTTYRQFHSNIYKGQVEHVTALCQDSRKDIWMGEWDSGLYKLNKQTGVFEHIAGSYQGNNSLTDTRIQKIYEYKPGILVIGTESGINIFDIDNNTCKQFIHDPKNQNSISGNAVQSNALVKDKQGNLWIGVWSGGLNKMSFDDSFQNVSFEHYKNDLTNTESLSNDNVISLHNDKAGNIWIGTFGEGLSKLDHNTKTFKHYTTLEGLPNNIVYSIIEDEKGFLWLSTDGGLSMFDPINETFKNYYSTDGLQSDHFFWGSSHKGNSGALYFGGIEGFNSFNPTSSVNKEYSAPIVLVSLKVLNEEYNTGKSIAEVKEIELKHNENFLTFEFASLDYSDPQRIRYQYQMEGIDKDWIYSGDRRFAGYTEMEPGEYIFKVKTSDSYDKSNVQELEITITIKPPWWRTWWAKTGFITLIIGSILAVYFLRIRILELQKKRLAEQVRDRTFEINKTKNEITDKNIELTKTLEQLELTQQALIESEKMASIGIMSAGIAHEINNPLNFISVSIDNINTLINEIKQDSYKISKENLDMINKLFDHSKTGINRISNIITSLKTYSYKGEGVKELTDITKLIDSALTILHSKIGDTIEFSINYIDSTKVLCKSDQISQVLLNLIDNAVDAIKGTKTDKKEKISIETKDKTLSGKKYLQINISNTGTKISEEKIKHIFDPFYTTKSPNKGTGLGLYISYNIINEHNGILKAENTFKGVKFLIYLPL